MLVSNSVPLASNYALYEVILEVQLILARSIWIDCRNFHPSCSNNNPKVNVVEVFF
jgi:hypothetical protein